MESDIEFVSDLVGVGVDDWKLYGEESLGVLGDEDLEVIQNWLKSDEIKYVHLEGVDIREDDGSPLYDYAYEWVNGDNSCLLAIRTPNDNDSNVYIFSDESGSTVAIPNKQED